jgi:phosphonate transport system substrate-binding protein
MLAMSTVRPSPRPGVVPLAIVLFVAATLAAVLYALGPNSSPVLRPSELPTASSSPRERPLRIAMSAAFVSEDGVPVYGEIVDYLSEKAGTRYELVTGLAYGTINQMLADGAVDFGFICGYPYVLAHDKLVPEMEVLVGPVMKAPRYLGRPVYYSDLVVHRDSTIRSLDDLRGRTYVYNEETSNSGYNMPRSHLVERGLTNGFFGKVLRSGSHEESIRMVAEGLADASYVDSLVLDYAREQPRGHASRVRVIESLGPAPVVPLVASTRVPAAERERVRRHLLDMHQDERGRKILDRALVDRFAVVSDEDYDAIRAMEKRARDIGFMVIR